MNSFPIGETSNYAHRIREVILNGTWIANTNFKDQLEGLNWQTAVAKIESLNTISLLAQHIHYYIAGLKHVFEGGNLDIRDKFSFDFKPIESQSQWDAFLNRFWEDTEAFAKLIEKMPDERLYTDFVDKNYGTFQRNIDGMIEHCYYHLGQIVLIKKLVLKEG